MALDLESYFRMEARELLDGLLRGFLDLEKQPEQKELISHCFRLAHTLKGAARAVKKARISEMAHLVEDALMPLREDPGNVRIESDLISDLLKIVESIRTELAVGDASAQSDPIPVFGATAERLDSVRIELTQMDELLENLSEATVRLGALDDSLDALSNAHRTASSILQQLRGNAKAAFPSPLLGTSDVLLPMRMGAALEELVGSLGHVKRDLTSGLSQLERELGEVKTRANDLRLVPVSAIFSPLELAVRDASQLLHKRIEFQAVGGDVRIEGQVLPAVRDALLHALRNAVDHGIESASERLLAGKPQAGRIQLSVERHGRQVAFRVYDDGRGIDVEAVRRVALLRKLLSESEAQALSPQEALHLVFRPGVSTSPTVSEISGRGIGLDIVRETARRYKGEISIETQAGQSTTLQLMLPAAISSVPCLVAVFYGQTLLIPLDAIRETRRLVHKEIFHQADKAWVMHEGRAVPFLSLGPELGEPERISHRCSLIVLHTGNHLIGLGAERLVGTREVLVKPLPACIGPSSIVMGASLDAKGDPLLVLDPRALGAAAHRQSRRPLGQTAAPRQPILIIDDSLTTRMLEQSILESAGYTVELAASAEEGLQMAKERSYALFIVDVEMPGMNGFEFTATTRADPVLRAVPVILVTSLSSAAHRRRGSEAGAAAYIVKGEFDQKSFTRKVAELVG